MNFFLPNGILQIEGRYILRDAKEKISAGYFRVIRNYYRFGCVDPYLFGASPAICSSSCKENQHRCRSRKPSAVCITCRMRLSSFERSRLYQ
ncbi:MAG: hypothetical protein ACLTGU_10635 [Escherichia coli]